MFLLAALVTTTLLYSAPAQSLSCEDERLKLVDPVVSVVAGPGDAAQEQERWTSLSPPYMGGHQLHFDGQMFDIEEAE